MHLFSWWSLKGGGWQKTFVRTCAPSSRYLISAHGAKHRLRRGRNKTDSQPRRIYLHYFQQQQTSKFSWWQPRDFIISVILSLQMFPSSLFFFLVGMGVGYKVENLPLNVCEPEFLLNLEVMRGRASCLCALCELKDSSKNKNPEHYWTAALKWTNFNFLKNTDWFNGDAVVATANQKVNFTNH